jgi:hypothetical protein
MRHRWSPLLLFAATAIAFLAGLGKSNASSPTKGPFASAHASIIGGGPVPIRQFPWLAFVNAVDSQHNLFGCTGSVVAPRVILTAGHCLYDSHSQALVPPSQYSITTGVANLRFAEVKNTFLVSKTALSPAFSPSILRSDAGLLVLEKPVGVPPLALASEQDQALLTKGTPISIVGWGETASPTVNPPPLQASSTVVQGPSYCQRQVNEFDPSFSSDSQFCAINPPGYSTGLCHGDSGSPAIAYTTGGAPVEVGIGSLGEPKCSTVLPNVFTRTDLLQPWIQSWIAAVESDAPPPSTKQPRVTLPFLTLSKARQLVAKSLAGEFKDRYLEGTSKRTSCRRIARPRVKCEVLWKHRGNEYHGTITIYYLFTPDAVSWNNRYKIAWASSRCRAGSRQGKPCIVRIQTR